MEYFYNIYEIPEVASALLKDASNKIFAFIGEMGVGKTTLIKEVIAQLGVEDNVTSPTFSLVNEYEAKGKQIFHFDLYRINDLEEVLDIGFEEYLQNGDYIFIEWPEKILHLLPENYTSITLTKTKNNNRKLLINKNSRNC